MTISDCIRTAIDGNELDRATGEEAISQFEQLRQKYESRYGYSPAQAAASAASDLKEATRKDARSRQHKALHQLMVMRELRETIRSAADPAMVPKFLIEGHTREGNFTGQSIRGRREAHWAMVVDEFQEALKHHAPDLKGDVRNRAGFLNLIREAHGEKTGDVLAARFAETLKGIQLRLLQRVNKMGGSINVLDGYGIAHAHAPEALKRVGFERWSDHILRLGDWHRMIDKETGRPFAAEPGGRPDPEAARRFLDRQFQTITTGGANSLDPTMSANPGALYKQHDNHREIHFRDGTSWLEYNKTFGTSDPFSAMLNGLQGLVDDIAEMEVLGPNPTLGLEFAIQEVKAQAARMKTPRGADILDRVEKTGATARLMLGEVNGTSAIPHHIEWAAFGGKTRSYLASTQLGSAIVSSVTDEATVAASARIIGLNPLNVFSTTLRYTLSGATREQAARAGFVAERLGDAIGGAARFRGEIVGAGLAERFAAATMRLSGLSFLTDARKIAIQWEQAAKLADMADLPFDGIDPRSREFLARRGVTAEDWDALRHPSGRFVADNGADFISPMYWRRTQTVMDPERAYDLALRVQMAVEEEMEVALPAMSVEARAWALQGARPGTFVGELGRSAFQYRGFTASMMLSQIRRTQAQSTLGGKAGYAAMVFLPMWFLGAVALQNKEIIKGNDPRPMDDPAFWLAAGLQGGGFGIFGDFFSASTSRTGGGFAEALGGPSVGLIGELARLAFNPDMNTGRAAARLQRNYTPIWSTLWYTRLGFARVVSDQIQLLLDPEARKDFARRAKQMKKDYGTETGWQQGEWTPDRGPDLMNAFGGAP